MTPDQAADLAARTLAAIDAVLREPQRDQHAFLNGHPVHNRAAADRERVASDLAGLRRARSLMDALHDHDAYSTAEGWYIDCTESLRRTAALYGVTP